MQKQKPMPNGQSICGNENNSKFIIYVQKMPGNLALRTSISYLLTASKCTMWKSLYPMSYNSTTTF